MHRKPWFKEKYSPDEDLVEWRSRVKAKARAGRLDNFLTELEEGKLDDVSFDYQSTSVSDLCYTSQQPVDHSMFRHSRSQLVAKRDGQAAGV